MVILQQPQQAEVCLYIEILYIVFRFNRLCIDFYCVVADQGIMLNKEEIPFNSESACGILKSI